jgi:hypothetical protein
MGAYFVLYGDGYHGFVRGLDHPLTVDAIPINEGSIAVRLLHDLLFEKYGSCLAQPRSGFNFLGLVEKSAPYIDHDLPVAGWDRERDHEPLQEAIT